MDENAEFLIKRPLKVNLYIIEEAVDIQKDIYKHP